MRAYSEILLYEKNRLRSTFYKLFVRNNRLVIQNTDTGDIQLANSIDLDDYVLSDGTTSIDYTTGSQKIGNVTGGNYAEIEDDGTLRIHGDGTTWDDTMASAGIFRTGVSSLTLDTLVGNIQQYRFDLNDEVYVPGIQFPHKMEVNTVVSPHIHIINKTAIGATNYNIRFEFEWAWANINRALGTTTSADVTMSLENTDALTHKVFEFGDITPSASQGGISSILICRVKRVAAASNAYNSNDIFTIGIDIHFKIDTLGSRTEYIK